MKENREAISRAAELLAYKLRAGEISKDGGDIIYQVILHNPDKVDSIIDIMDMDLLEAETIARIKSLQSI